MRSVIAVTLFAAVTALVGVSQPAFLAAQDKKDEKKAKQKVDPKTFIPDDVTKKQIADKTEELRKAVAALKEKRVGDDVLIEVEIYLKAAENIVRFEEWLAAASVKWVLTTLDEGLKRAKQAEGDKAVWRDAPGKWVVRAYRSRIDNSIQPYAVLLPHDFGKDPQKKWRLDIVLHGRDAALTEAKFIATHQGNAPKDLGYIQLEVYGRGNNAYRWAGETDVFEAAYSNVHAISPPEFIDPGRVVLRGFSMGGAGTWHIGLHHPAKFCVIGPGAGFTTTHGYIAGLPKELPDYQEKCLRIYDAVGYAENAFNVPVVAYSGEKDAQKKAADNIENALKGFKEPLKFTHLVAPGLEHQMPKEWQEKAEAEYRKYADTPRNTYPDETHFVTYTLRYGEYGLVQILRLEEHYKKSVLDIKKTKTGYEVKTENVIAFSPHGDGKYVIDGQAVEGEQGPFLKIEGKWVEVSPKYKEQIAIFEKGKTPRLQGPIDDAFTNWFEVVEPSKAGWHVATTKYALAAVDQFAALWDRYFRGKLRMKEGEYDPRSRTNLILFGDPQSNPLIAKALPQLPITWTKEKLVVNGVEYDPKTHIPVLIYPNPLYEGNSSGKRYVVINSGHTFKEADLKGTNALLYPRLGDWAVIKPTPTDKDPAAYEVVAAGLFDENWQFPKKK
jgi:dienelactone hydrolase